jgi:CRP/FNR family transcriptional regulator, cyclic AMP receptor protein
MLRENETPDGQPAKVARKDRSPVLILSSAKVLNGRKPLLMDRLTPAECETVIAHCTPKLAKRHSTIFTQGHKQVGIYLILSGGVRVFYAAPSGREITRAYWFAGNFIGGPHVFGEMPHMWSAIAMRDTSLLMLPCATLHSLCLRIPNVAIGLIEAMGFKGRCYSAMAQMLGTRTAGERMTQVLLLLAEMYGQRSECGTAVSVPITHEEIAHMVGATRQWVTIGLKRLQAQGVIEVSRGHLLIRDLESLADAAAE